MSLSFEPPRTAQEAVLGEIRRRLLDRRLSPGQHIRPGELSAELGVSHVPIREALKILEGEGQVQYRPHHGYSVTKLDLSDLIEIYRIRELLESEVAKHAVPRLVDSDLERMDDAVAEMESYQGDDISVLTAANRRFHFTLIEGADLQHMQHFIRLLWDATDPYRSLYYMDPRCRDAVNVEHRTIVAAVRDGDLERVVHELDRHRENAIRGLREILS